MRRILLLLLSVSISVSAAPTAQDILRRADRARFPAGDLSFLVKAFDKEAKRTVKETHYRVVAKGADHALIETVFPARQQGRKLLMRDNGLWLYLPTLQRPARVSLHQRLTGEVSNGDLARTDFDTDYTPRLESSAVFEGAPCFRLRLTAKNPDTAYRMIRLWVEKKSYRPRKAEFFALSGKLMKTGVYSDFKRSLGGVFPHKWTIRDALKPARRTELVYSQYKRETLSVSYFNKESMVD